MDLYLFVNYYPNSFNYADLVVISLFGIACSAKHRMPDFIHYEVRGIIEEAMDRLLIEKRLPVNGQPFLYSSWRNRNYSIPPYLQLQSNTHIEVYTRLS
jgi:hypothetical protein